MNRILLVEDDKSLADALVYSLNRNGFETDTAASAAEAQPALREGRYELLLLDVGLPDMTGFELCRRIRESGSRIPIIFLTAMDEEVNVVRGLDGGGDDYITKPFRLSELCSRMRALLRRSGESAEKERNVLRSGGVTVELDKSRALLDGVPLALTGAEYRLLCLLIRNAGNVLTRAAILDELWDGSGSFVDDNTLSVYIRRLWEKIERDPSNPEHLLTVRGFGYRWRG